jgi:hypothetical protein
MIDVFTLLGNFSRGLHHEQQPAYGAIIQSSLSMSKVSTGHRE